MGSTFELGIWSSDGSGHVVPPSFATASAPHVGGAARGGVAWGVARGSVEQCSSSCRLGTLTGARRNRAVLHRGRGYAPPRGPSACGCATARCCSVGARASWSRALLKEDANDGFPRGACFP